MARVVRSVISTLPFSSTSPSRSPVSGVVVGVGETGVGSAVGSDAVGEGDAVVGSGDGSGEEVGSGDGDGEGEPLFWAWRRLHGAEGRTHLFRGSHRGEGRESRSREGRSPVAVLDGIGRV